VVGGVLEMGNYRTIQERLLALIPCKLERFQKNLNLRFTADITIKYALRLLIERGLIYKDDKSLYRLT